MQLRTGVLRNVESIVRMIAAECVYTIASQKQLVGLDQVSTGTSFQGM